MAGKAIETHVPKISKLKRRYLFQRLNDLQQMMEIFTFMSLGLLIKSTKNQSYFFLPYKVTLPQKRFSLATVAWKCTELKTLQTVLGYNSMYPDLATNC